MMSKAKPFDISKQIVWEAYKRVKANKGSEGIDDETIKDFEGKLKDNLYKIWNRMSSGTYFPPHVKMVEIPKADGKKRILGIPTVADRIAQMVVKMYLEPTLDPQFHPDSYGYRPNKSAKQAITKTRERCWQYEWVIDLDIKGFFDNMDHELLMKAVEKHTQSKWILMYIGRWLKVSAEKADGTIIERTKGTPQGGVISPLLANLFMHYAFDKWIERNHPRNPFERYADDIVIHCATENEALILLRKIKERLKECKLELHPEKTKIVQCKRGNNHGIYPNEKFDFLGYTFKKRKAKSKSGDLFTGFLPAVGDKAIIKIQEKILEWEIHQKTCNTLDEIAEMINPTVRGWINYYGYFYKSELDQVLRKIEYRLIKWAVKKYKKFKGSVTRAAEWLRRIRKRDPKLLAHWT
jgi:RNA-directed DNA polymerase